MTLWELLVTLALVWLLGRDALRALLEAERKRGAKT